MVNQVSINTTNFRDQVKTWLNHKLILAGKSKAFMAPERQKAIQQLRNAFGEFLQIPNYYSLHKLAERIVKNEDILYLVLPVPGNPAFHNSEAILKQIIDQATEIVNHIT